MPIRHHDFSACQPRGKKTIHTPASQYSGLLPDTLTGRLRTTQTASSDYGYCRARARFKLLARWRIVAHTSAAEPNRAHLI
jgi:hypothetical protein